MDNSYGPPSFHPVSNESGGYQVVVFNSIQVLTQPLPWYSCPPEEFPKRHRRRRPVPGKGSGVYGINTSSSPLASSSTGSSITSSALHPNSKKEPIPSSTTTLTSTPLSSPPAPSTLPSASSTASLQHDIASSSPSSASSPPAPYSAPKSWADLARSAVIEPNVKEPRENQTGTVAEHEAVSELEAIDQEALSTSINVQSENQQTSPQELNGQTVPILPSTSKISLSVFSKTFQVTFGPIEIVPRGLVNTGNICFMNSILQALLRCVPFYNLLQQVASQVSYKIQSDTPLLDGLTDFLRDFTAYNKTNNDGTKGLPPPFSPDTFYNTIASHPRFHHLKRGRQEDAEEFLSYLLDGLHEEFSGRGADDKETTGSSIASVTNQTSEHSNPPHLDGWQEVGKNNRKLNIRQTGATGDLTPITRLFGAQFKSILSVPTQQPSITCDPYQHIQLDISDPEIQSIEDAFEHMSRPETLQYRTLKGLEVKASKQVVLESVPPILIIHLKRFAFTSRGMQKISKPIAFPDDLTLPEACLGANQRALGLETFKLCAVVYHHGPAATAGHYTVDVRARDDSWVAIDDIQLSSAMDRSRSDQADKSAYLLFYVLNEGTLNGKVHRK